MQTDISHHRSLGKQSKARVIVIRTEEGDIAAWALLQPRRANDPRKGYLVYFYTRQKYRRQGFASRLMRHVQRFDPKPEVAPHDRRSGAFFKNFKKEIKYPEYQSTWLRV
jgi:GNAT superfamily N-acetyltransferase